MALIDDRITQFRAEIGDRELTEEQRKIFNAFCKKGGASTFVNVTDYLGNKVRLKIVSYDPSIGSQHILLSHYKTEVGNVTATEILNLCDIVKYGESYISGIYTVYRKQYENNGVLYRTVVKVSKEKGTSLLKSFYSDRGV